MISIDGETAEMIMPQGDTALVRIGLEWNVQPMSDYCAIIFSVKDDSGAEVIRKVMQPIDNACVLYFKNADTEHLEVGTYRWDLRVVLHPKYYGDDIDGGSEVHSAFALDRLPKFRIKEVVAYV